MRFLISPPIIVGADESQFYLPIYASRIFRRKLRRLRNPTDPFLEGRITFHQHRAYGEGSSIVSDVVMGYYPVLGKDVQKGSVALLLSRTLEVQAYHLVHPEIISGSRVINIRFVVRKPGILQRLNSLYFPLLLLGTDLQMAV